MLLIVREKNIESLDVFSVLYNEHNISPLYRDSERSRNRVHSVFSSMWFISETDSGTDILIESSGCCTPYLADLSANSLPIIPTWEGTQHRLISDPEVIRECISWFASIMSSGLVLRIKIFKAYNTDFESIKRTILLLRLKESVINFNAWIIPISSAVNIDIFFPIKKDFCTLRDGMVNPAPATVSIIEPSDKIWNLC